MFVCWYAGITTLVSLVSISFDAKIQVFIDNLQLCSEYNTGGNEGGVWYNAWGVG
jgi:hypothetical protein